jgi:hypothetical protein
VHDESERNGRGMKGRVDKSMGIGTLIAEALASIKPTELVDCSELYYESIKRELKARPINECWCDERLKTKDKS